MEHLKVIISGGGTGGHIFPALAIADQIKHQRPEAEILFVGAHGKMEMIKVPAHGYKIIGLDIRGIQRSLTLKNLLVPFKVIASLLKARSIVKNFKPHFVVGVGGYASGPLLKVSGWANIPYFIQEQNSYAGVTNKLLAPKAKKIFVAYENMEAFFPSEKIQLTGNPIRKNILQIRDTAKNYDFFGLQSFKKTVLVVGGSLGARTINESINLCLDELLQKNMQVIWQTGKGYYDTAIQNHGEKVGCKILPFIENMNEAYALADFVISRAGALSVSELCIVGKPVIFIPSPNVSEDHQTKNAMALVKKNAAVLVKDTAARTTLLNTLLDLMEDEEKANSLARNIQKLAISNADEQIVNEILTNLQL